MKGGSGREGGGEERKVRLTAKESASSPKWLENEGISSYAEAAVMFEGATDAVEKENELLRKQWPEGDIERVARLCKTFHSDSHASATQTKSKSAVAKPKSILRSDAKAMKGFRDGSRTVGDGEPWEKGHTWSTHHLGEWVFAGPALGWYRRDTTSLSEHRKLVAQEPEMVIDDPPCTDATPSIWHMARAMRAAEKRGRMKETWGMSQEDTKSTQPVSRQVEEWAERNMRNIAKTYITKVDANALLQKSDPEHYGTRPAGLTTRGAVIELLKVRDLYDQQPTALAPFDPNKLKILRPGWEVKPVEVVDRAPPEVREAFLNPTQFRRSEEEMEVIRASSDPVYPYWDPVLSSNRSERIKFTKQLADKGLVSFRREIFCKVGVLFLWLRNVTRLGW